LTLQQLANLVQGNRYWFVRENPDDTPFGPIDFPTANQHARALSNDKEKSGLAEIIVVMGSRDFDPPVEQLWVDVVFVYRRGKRLTGGNLASYQSRYRLPPAP